jgi:glycopeptide antibiotics resistance protein
VLIALNIGVFLGRITELLQGTTLITGRQCSVYDFIANVAGCFLGWGASLSGRKEKEKIDFKDNFCRISLIIQKHFLILKVLIPYT